MKIFCLIPAYNERGNLEELTKSLSRNLSKLKIKYKIFFVLQGNDGSAQLLKKIQKSNKHLDFIYFPSPLGIGKAYRVGFDKINKDFTHVLTLDADLNHNPDEIPKFIIAWKKYKWDMIVGSRFTSGGSFLDKRKWKRIISLLVNLFMTKLLGINIHDTTSGYRLIRREVIENVKSQLKEKDYPSYMELALLASSSGFNLGEVPIVYIPRKWGKSKMRKTSTLFNYIKFIPRIIANHYKSLRKKNINF